MAELKPLLDQYYEKARQHQKILLWSSVAFVFALIVLFFIYYLVQIYPVNQVSQFGINNVSEKADLINKYRTTSIQFIATFAQILGGIAIGIGIYFAWKNITVAQDTLKFNQENAQANLKVAQEGQITDRFTRAVDQLGNKKLEIRLGGIYALERILDESDKDYWPILEILTAYVRKNSSVESKNIKNKDSNNQNELSEDIKAILAVIRTRKYSIMEIESNNLYNEQAILRDYELFKTSLKGAEVQPVDFIEFAFSQSHKNIFRDREPGNLNLEKSYLRTANLFGIYLKKAYFTWSDLTGANLIDADLTEAHLYDANLQNTYLALANLTEANLEGANLEGANLMGAKLIGATLKRADLKGADFTGTNLKGAKNLTIDQLSTVKTLYNATLDEELEIPLKEKYPALFEKPN